MDSRYGTSLYGAWVSDVQLPPDPVNGADAVRCSAKGCRAAATTDLQWRNPRLHDEARIKHWMACDEHAESLGSYLSVRGFLLSSSSLG